jgi:hypothetical protein
MALALLTKIISTTLGKKNDSVHVGVADDTTPAMGYLKQLVNTTTSNDTVPTADSTANTLSKDVIGNKTDASVTVSGSTTSIIAYIKGLINGIFLNGYDSSGVSSASTGSLFQRLAYTRSIVGDSSATALYVISGTNTVMGLNKGLVDITEKAITRTTANIPQTTSTNIFTVTGAPIEILSIIGEVTTIIQNQVNLGKLQITDTASSTTRDICVAASIQNLAVGTFITITGTLASAMVTNAGGTAIAQAGGILCPIGAIKFNTSASSTGQIRWYLRYRPLGTSAVVTAA